MSLDNPPICILVTGFGAFPGTRSNPSAALVRALGKQKSRLGRLGIRLELEILPVAYAAIPRNLETLGKTHQPDAILHFGLAARRKVISIETRAMNRRSRLRPDAHGATARRLRILPGAPQHIRSTAPTVEIAAALCRAGITCRLSINAGKYICNETFYRSLVCSGARQVGFIHVPRLERFPIPSNRKAALHARFVAFSRREPESTSLENARAPQRRRLADTVRSRPTLDDLTRAAVIAVLVIARNLRRSVSAGHEDSRHPASLDPGPCLP